jgi:hypothetical protein
MRFRVVRLREKVVAPPLRHQRDVEGVPFAAARVARGELLVVEVPALAPPRGHV